MAAASVLFGRGFSKTILNSVSRAVPYITSKVNILDVFSTVMLD